MFGRWGAFVYRHRRIFAILAVAIALISVPFALRASSELGSGGFLDKDSESQHVQDLLASQFGAGRSSLLVLYSASQGTTAGSPAYQAQLATSLARLKADSRVAGIVGYAQTGDARFLSTDGRETYVVVELNLSEEESVPAIASLRSEIAPIPGTTIRLTGYGPITQDSGRVSETDLQRAESISFPLALLILLLVFASVIAAAMPLLVAALAIPTSLGIVYLVAQHVEMSIFVLSVSTMLGLSLAIDYSLFLVSRFREELRRGRSVGDAVERAVATSGKAVVFSGTAVGIGLMGLLLLKAPALASIGLGGAIVVVCSVLYAITFLPAVLGMLGPRVDSLSLGGLFRRLVRRPADAGRVATSRWEAVAHWVMRHPVGVLVPILVGLVALGLPVLSMQQGIPGASIYPPGLESRDAFVAIQHDFPPGETTPITIVAQVSGDPLSPDNVRALTEYAARLAALPNVSRVESPFSNLRDPSTGKLLTSTQIETLWSLPAAQRPPQLAALTKAYVRGSLVQLNAISPLDSAVPAATDMIPVIRGLPAGPGISTQVGGAAALGHDFLTAMNDRLPWVVGLVIGAMLVILFLLFGSLVLPVKAVFMTLLSISASFGALVWIFQDGHLANVLDFQPLGYTIAGTPVIMFCVLFGLSMDYEVLLLSRVQEAWRRTADNTAAVAEGLARTAAVITGAALIMVSVFAAFALAQVITIKSLGVGMAIAVAVDATIIRVLLVPATMRLLGRWNWWAPGPLGRFADRLGFSHVEGEEGAAPRGVVLETVPAAASVALGASPQPAARPALVEPTAVTEALAPQATLPTTPAAMTAPPPAAAPGPVPTQLAAARARGGLVLGVAAAAVSLVALLARRRLRRSRDA